MRKTSEKKSKAIVKRGPIGLVPPPVQPPHIYSSATAFGDGNPPLPAVLNVVEGGGGGGLTPSFVNSVFTGPEGFPPNGLFYYLNQLFTSSSPDWSLGSYEGQQALVSTTTGYFSANVSGLIYTDSLTAGSIITIGLTRNGGPPTSSLQLQNYNLAFTASTGMPFTLTGVFFANAGDAFQIVVNNNAGAYGTLYLITLNTSIVRVG